MAVNLSSTSVISPKFLGKIISQLCCYAEPEIWFEYSSFYRGGKLRPTFFATCKAPKRECDRICYDWRFDLESKGLLADVSSFTLTDDDNLDKIRIKICLH